MLIASIILLCEELELFIEDIVPVSPEKYSGSTSLSFTIL